MKIVNLRFGHGKTSSAGSLLIDDVPFAFIIEDEPRDIKVKGETRIPSGTYKLGIRKDDTPLTVKHRKAYNKPGDEWFKYHIEVLNVPNFTGVYWHAGNKESDTEACQMPNYNASVIRGEYVGSSSVLATKAFYALVYPLLEKGKEVLYTIKDCDL